MTASGLENWKAYMASDHRMDLGALIHEDCVFRSPIVHTPQKGKAITLLYLAAAAKVLGNESFRYVREYGAEKSAALEFECRVGGVDINGIDLIEWDKDGLLTDFKVMIRPLQAIEMVHKLMGYMLVRMKENAQLGY
ncbi:MAG: nuclear transport factor 2 family protein [Pseudomonadota bacterium]